MTALTAEKIFSAKYHQQYKTFMERGLCHAAAAQRAKSEAYWFLQACISAGVVTKELEK